MVRAWSIPSTAAVAPGPVAAVVTVSFSGSLGGALVGVAADLRSLDRLLEDEDEVMWRMSRMLEWFEEVDEGDEEVRGEMVDEGLDVLEDWRMDPIKDGRAFRCDFGVFARSMRGREAAERSVNGPDAGEGRGLKWHARSPSRREEPSMLVEALGRFRRDLLSSQYSGLACHTVRSLTPNRAGSPDAPPSLGSLEPGYYRGQMVLSTCLLADDVVPAGPPSSEARATSVFAVRRCGRLRETAVSTVDTTSWFKSANDEVVLHATCASANALQHLPVPGDVALAEQTTVDRTSSPWRAREPSRVPRRVQVGVYVRTATSTRASPLPGALLTPCCSRTGCDRGEPKDASGIRCCQVVKSLSSSIKAKKCLNTSSAKASRQTSAEHPGAIKSGVSLPALQMLSNPRPCSRPRPRPRPRRLRRLRTTAVIASQRQCGSGSLRAGRRPEVAFLQMRSSATRSF